MKKQAKPQQNKTMFMFINVLFMKGPRWVKPTLPSKTVPGTIPHTDPATSTSNSKHPVSANCVEVLAGAANECVWCQPCVLCPCSSSARRIHEDESQKKLKGLGNTCQPCCSLEIHDCPHQTLQNVNPSVNTSIFFLQLLWRTGLTPQL